MAKEHNFKIIPLSQRMRGLIKVRRFHCADCDTIVEYPAKYTEHEVNHLVSKGRLACLPPIEVPNFADSKYYDEKYGGKPK